MTPPFRPPYPDPDPDIDPDIDDGAAGRAEADLWFLPGPAAAPGPPLGLPFAPSPRPAAGALGDPAAWRAAQQGLSAELARLAQAFGELDAALRARPEGLRHRLALREAADLSWWTGERLAAERLGLWSALRIGSTAESGPALMRAGWAVRRLSGGEAPAADPAGFLERPDEGADPRETAALAGLLAAGAGLHPVTGAALLFHGWHRPGAPGGREWEAAVLAARQGAAMSRRPGAGALFLPLATGGAGGLRAGGPPAQRLAAWIAGAERAVLAALLQIERLLLWERSARAAVAALSGRTPARLVAVLVRWPLVSARLAEAETGASRAAVQRNLDRLAAAGLIRELTGQGRYRLWTARI